MCPKENSHDRPLTRLPLCALLFTLTAPPRLRAADEAPATVRTSPACFAFGGLPADVTGGLKKLPPTLKVHGDKDRTVSVKEAYDVHGFMTAKSLTSEIVVYHTDHMFLISETEVDLWAAQFAQARATEFLHKNLHPGVARE